MSSSVADVAVVGAGIMGLATAHELTRRRPGIRVAVLDKENRVSAHQSGHNSGVIHSGLYYRPGSMKARTCTRGRAELTAFCDEHGIHYSITGKVVVATSDDELGRLDELERRGRANGLAVERISPGRLVELEPHATGVAALHVPETGVVDFGEVCATLAKLVEGSGGELLLGHEVTGIAREGENVLIETDGGHVRARRVVNCAGLHSDRVAAAAGDRPAARIMPFRGEFRNLRPEAAHLCRTLIYPVPDPSFPFLGVHLTRGVDGHVHVGPNAVPATAREGYRGRDFDPRDTWEMLTARSSWVLARRHWRTGSGEIWRSFSERAFVRALRRLVPEVGRTDLEPAPSGVRAQAISPAGDLLDDFVISRSGPVLNVVNAPSPAATACLVIAAEIVDQLDG